MKDKHRHSNATFGSSSKWTTRAIMILMIAVNVCLVVAMISCVIVYTTQNRDEAYNQNMNYITNIATAQTELAQTILNNSGTTVVSISNYGEGKTVDEVIGFLDTTIGDSEEEYQLLTVAEINATQVIVRGLSTRKDNNGRFQTVEYVDTSTPGLIEVLLASGPQTGTISYTTEFTNRTNGIKSYASFCGLNLDDGGTIKHYYLLNPKSTSSLLSKLRPSSQYPDLILAICDSEGNYLASESGFKALNFFDFISEFNNLSLDTVNSIKAAIQADEDGVGLLFYKDAKSRDCTFAYSEFTGETDWYVIVCVPNMDFISDELFPTFPFVIIIILIMLLAIDMLALLKIISRLRASVINEKYANQAKTDFLSHISHDMRTPLNSIINFSEFIGSTSELKDAKEYADKVNSAGKYLLTLINDTLSMSRIEAGHLFINPEPVTFKDFEDGLISILGDKAEKKGIDFTIDAPGLQDLVLLIDPLRLQQVFVNLLNNAIKFTPDGGKVSLIVNSIGRTDKTIRLKFQVSDTGRGMSNEFLENRLFKAFSQENSTGQDTEESGTGLGLSIAKNVVEQMGGEITCKSELGKGTTFTIIISATVIGVNTGKPEDQKTENVPDNNAILKGKHILVCEDNYLNKEIAVHLLSAVGCIVDTADNGQIGVDLFSQSAENYYDAVLMDKRMPVMDGIEATKHIRALDRDDSKEVPIIALSADVFDEHIEKSLLSGMTAYLSKPIDPKALYKELVYRISKRYGADL